MSGLLYSLHPSPKVESRCNDRFRLASTVFNDTKASAKDKARDELIQVLTGRSAEAISWLMEKVRHKYQLSSVEAKS